MIATYQRLQRRRAAGEINGFTLIELLIVIVVLGILAAVVIFALGGITGKSAIAACQSDGATVSTALAAFKAENPTIATTAITTADLDGTSTTTGGPYIQSWPSATVAKTGYAFTLVSGVLTVATTGTPAATAYKGTANCSGA